MASVNIMLEAIGATEAREVNVTRFGWDIENLLRQEIALGLKPDTTGVGVRSTYILARGELVEPRANGSSFDRLRTSECLKRRTQHTTNTYR